jgi:hypothetical protein
MWPETLEETQPWVSRQLSAFSRQKRGDFFADG